MNPSAQNNEQTLEAVLRRAPAPPAPATLEGRLVEQINLHPGVETRNGSSAGGRVAPPRGWRRWWPMLLPTAAAAAFATTVVIQQSEIAELQREMQQQAQQQQVEPALVAGSGVPAGGLAAMPDPRDEIARLRALVDSLLSELRASDQLAADNARLKAAIAVAMKAMPPEVQELQEVKNRAARIQCVNNMKQLGLAVRVWATDNEDRFPTDILSMTNELVSPKLLVCPSDEVRHAADSWSAYTAANCSYEFLSMGPKGWENEPQRVMFRCPIHSNVTLCDGSVQQLGNAGGGSSLVSRNGGLYLENTAPVIEVQPGGTAAPAPMELTARYGIEPNRVVVRVVSTNLQTGEVTDSGEFIATPDSTSPQPLPPQ